MAKPLVIKGSIGLMLHCKLMDEIFSWSLKEFIRSWVVTDISSDQNYKDDNGMSVGKSLTLVPTPNEAGFHHFNLKCDQELSLLDQHIAHLH